MGNTLEESYYDKNEKPMLNKKLGYYKQANTFNQKGLQTGVAFSEPMGSP